MSECLTMTDQSYYIGANTSLGFVNCADERLRGLSKLYVIKGGPGTGKSTFMKEIASRANSLGYGVERYYCSSDPLSLDAVVIPSLSVGVADGTSPHVIEPTKPGVREELLDFGRFWNSEFLCACQNTLSDLFSKKSSCFSSAYRYLKAASVLRSEEEDKLRACFDRSKAENAVKRIMSQIKSRDGFECVKGQISAFGMDGKSTLNTFEDMSDVIYTIPDKRGIASMILDLVLDEAKRKRLKTKTSIDPLMRTDAVFLPEPKVTFTVYGTGRIINAERFILRDSYNAVKGKLRFIKYLKDELLTSAQMELNEAKKYHFSLESIYSEAMDYIALNDMTENFIKCSLKL